MSDFAASLSYRLLLAVFPFAIFLAATAALLSRLFDTADPTSALLTRFGDALPASARPLIEDQLRSVLDTRSGSLLSIGILGALWSASGGVGAAMRGMNRAFDAEERRPRWRRTGIALGLTVSSAIFFIAAFALVVGGDALARWLVDALGAAGTFGIVARVVQAAVGIALLMLAVAAFYWAAPAGTRPFEWLTPGALLFVVGWLAVSVGFAQYVARFGSYEATYGTLGGVVVLMVWLYLTAYLLLFGAELNAVVVRERAADEANRRALDFGRTAPRPRRTTRSERGFTHTRAGRLAGALIATTALVAATSNGRNERQG